MTLILVFVVLVGLVFLGRGTIIPAISPMPDNLGVKDGQLASCPSSPNCVSTQANPADALHYLQPLALNDASAEDVLAAVQSFVEQANRAEVVSTQSNYIHATFKSNLWGFIDDFEVYVDEEAGLIHVRSAARLGYGDGNVNRNRAVAFQRHLASTLFAASQPDMNKEMV